MEVWTYPIANVGLTIIFAEVAKPGWKLGDPITNLTANILRMKRGLAPQYINPKTGLLESMELHHTIPQREGGLFDFMKVTPAEHSRIDPFRILKQ